MLPCLLCTPPSPSSTAPRPRSAISVGACLWFHSSSILTHARLVQLWLLEPCFCLITRASPPIPSKIISCMTINYLKCNIENFSQAKQRKIANFIFNGTPSPSCTCCYRVPGTTLAGEFPMCTNASPPQYMPPDFPNLFTCTKSKPTCPHLPFPHNPAKTGQLVWETNLSWVLVNYDLRYPHLPFAKNFKDLI